jgi:predicted RNase H-like HicB family nuclease
MRYTVVLEQAPNNWAAYVPDLPGCITTGATREETLANIREAIALHLESMAEDGDPIPTPGTWVAEVEIDDAIVQQAR